MKVTVTHDLIRSGMVAECYRCPVAIAFRKSGLDACVGHNWVEIGGAVYKLPQRLADWMLFFDHGRKVVEISFEFDQARGIYGVQTL